MISIVIPVHNRKKFTRNCLLSLERQTVHEHNIIVVDDGSTDGTGEMLEHEFPEVTVITGNGNLFWTAAVNLGIRHALVAGADYVMTLNNDTIAAVDFMEKMLYRSAEEPDALLGALDIDFGTLKPYYGGEVTHQVWNTSRYLLQELEEKDWKGLHEVSLFPGRGLLIPRVVFEAIGLFEEEKLPHYMADYDFTVLARRNGFKVYCNYDAHLFTYPEEGGDHKIRKKKSLRNYYNHLFSIKGGGNLRNFTIYTLRNSPAGLVPMHLIKGYVQRVFGYLIH
ncbi:glycosyl transferase, family 2 [Fulvivirga imtechensis AK7]|uniref:Glycosyl transferase, family 2 n=1 Tax=Fulvivirga imtechensis AK7 TaxID=1237149 RepID=L8JJT0_9BACT|nr:glycosyltransferase family 2 protein [Fulvivirga imtechensis]ELR68508.1 glycosyl transferase, family 2 [Fulvivirga imtechensis AK7]